MGSEQSSQVQETSKRQTSIGGKSSAKSSNLRRQHTIANPGAPETEDGFENTKNTNHRAGSISPGPSLCSDVDLPYISYTVNRPIGDSPKLTNKQLVKTKSAQRKVQYKLSKTAPAHDIVIVKRGNTEANIEKDEDVLRLQDIPMFLPIMRATLSLPSARDPEVLERLDPAPLNRLCVRYQNHLTSCANLVSTEQNALTQRVREIDAEITRLINATKERQKKFSKDIERLSKVHDLSHQLNKCHVLLNETLESFEDLNNRLDIEERLEPFVWTTG